ncbi:MAG TPA: hypothetical protein VLL08_29995 [Kineosporiaceae bacterium]|nr:hypothetical protein [Kineosporiaceae bacterium]
MKEFDVESPQLMVCVYPAGSQGECFIALCQALVGLGCKPGQETARHLARNDSDAPMVDAGFQHRLFGTVTVGYGWYSNGHVTQAPWLVVRVHAHGSWSGTRLPRIERRAAEQLDPWTREVLRLCVNQCQVYYGTIGFECSLITSTELDGGWNGMPSSIFVSGRVLTGHPQVRAAFEADYRRGEVQEWDSGRLFSSGASSDAGWVGGSDRTANLLGRAVYTMTLKAAMAQDQSEAVYGAARHDEGHE